ncbi:MAG: DHH family phosphoesterase [Gemmatimonadota bacterium]
MGDLSRDQAEDAQTDAQIDAPAEPGPQNPRRPTAEQTARLSELLRAVEGTDRVYVLTHDNPDPDGIASSAALAYLLEHVAGKQTSVLFGGIVGRAENRALMDELGIEFSRMETTELEPSALVALVDTQPRSGNNSLPEGRIATIVIDHHPETPASRAAAFVDIRPEYGACCSMMTEYLRIAKLEPDRRLATALFYGIQTETMDLGREVSEADVSSSLFLYPRSDPAATSRIRHPSLPLALFHAIHYGLEHGWRREGVVCIPLGRLAYPDLGAQLADLFVRGVGVTWSVVAGRYGDQLLLSLRTFEPTAHAGELVREVVGERGSAGGHGTMAGASLDVRTLSEAEYDTLLESLFDDLCTVLGAESSDSIPLIGKDEG